MLIFILKRLMWGIPVLFAVATLTFILMHIVPGGPFDQEKVLPPEIKANVEASITSISLSGHSIHYTCSAL